MPLLRFEVRNEYGLGNPELYAQANQEDPKAVLDGVAVAGLVGILRQLGDLAEFAAEVFHGLQEQVMATSSRSHKLMARVRNIEAALPPLEKVVLAQTSHIHFAYTAGSEWHPRIRNERNHFIHNDLPCFIMESYEECRDPPRLHLLDKFDTGGPGSCLKRYSDPTFFKRASATSDEPNADKVQKDHKARRSKKKRSSKRCGDVSRGAPISNTRNCSMQFMSPIIDGINSPQSASTADIATICDLGDHSNSFGSRTESGFIECVFYPSSSMQPEEQEHKESPSSKLVQHNETLDYNFSDELVGFVNDNFPQESIQGRLTSASSCFTWDEKVEIVEPKNEDSGTDESQKLQPESIMDLHVGDGMSLRIVDQMESNLTDESILLSITSKDQVDETESETDNYMDALNTIESESENYVECQTKREVDEFNCDVINEETGGIHEFNVHCVDIHPPLFDSHIASNISLEKEMPAVIGKSVLSENLACKQIPPSYVSSNNKIPAELPNSICSKGHAFKQISYIARESSDVEGSEFIHESADICNDSKLEAAIDEQIPASYISSNNKVPADLPESICSDGHAFKQISYIARESSDVEGSESIHESADICNDSKLEADIDPSYSASISTDMQDPPADKLVGSSLESQEILDNLSCNPPIRFWTNGGLLGLEPSKPPDFTKLNDRTQDSVSRNKAETYGSSNCWHILKDEGCERKLNNMAESTSCDENDSNSKCSTSCHHDQPNSSSNKMSLGFSSTKLNSTNGNYGDLPMHNGYSNAGGTDTKETTVAGPRMVLPEATGDKSKSSEHNVDNCELPSLVFGLRQRLLSNSFGRKIPNINGDKHVPVIYENVLEQSSEYQRVIHQKAPENPFEEQFGCALSVDSLTSSPPLEHMKISFHPVDSFQTSKLKLKFSDVNQSRENIQDPFPSFQLIPEPALPLHDIASDSDDDTFCRSSPYMSEDHLSHHSHSDSEQWESEESPYVKDHEGYDALCGISAECISTSPELDGVPNGGICYLDDARNAFSGNGTVLSLSDSVLDLPSFDAMKPTFEWEKKDDSGPNPLDLGCTGNPSPAPPPLPPVQWCVSKHSSDGTENKDHTCNVFIANNLGSTIFHKRKLAPEKQQTNGEPIILIPKAELQLKSIEQKDTNQTLNSMGLDEREDFLQQIRTKSFNLRRTGIAKSTITPPPTNVKVTAILEKASAIRQAVGSDDGEDDNSWSDT